MPYFSKSFSKSYDLLITANLRFTLLYTTFYLTNTKNVTITVYMRLKRMSFCISFIRGFRYGIKKNKDC